VLAMTFYRADCDKRLNNNAAVHYNFYYLGPLNQSYMNKLFTRLCITSFVLLLASQIHAQTPEAIKAQMVKDWERAKAYTMEYLNTMPADKYSLKANDSIRSFAQQMLHLAAANVGLLSSFSTETPPAGIGFTLEQRPGAQVKDSVVHYVMASYDYARNTVKNSDITKWGEVKKVFNRFEETQFGFMMKTFEHQTHHRGQTTIYIRLAGIKPPQEKLF
jgi:uncharacterized damage-inducible protein DinB